MSNAATYEYCRRELAQRVSDGIEVTLYWGPNDGTIIVEVLDHKAWQTFQVTVPSECALDAFHHPYAYASHQGVEVEFLLPQAA
jgi:hypothetical protein